jgi:hypothetical protein
MKVKGKRVLLKPLVGGVTKNGILLPDSVKTFRYTIVAVGDKCSVEPEQKAIVHQQGIPFLYNGEDHFIFHEDSLELIFEKDEII